MYDSLRKASLLQVIGYFWDSKAKPEYERMEFELWTGEQSEQLTSSINQLIHLV